MPFMQPLAFAVLHYNFILAAIIQSTAANIITPKIHHNAVNVCEYKLHVATGLYRIITSYNKKIVVCDKALHKMCSKRGCVSALRTEQIFLLKKTSSERKLTHFCPVPLFCNRESMSTHA